MREITFGFDLGTNSIGWAAVNAAENKILGMGSIIFPMGVNLEKGSKEVSKNETRREKRQGRRQLFRKKIRKSLLVQELVAHGLFPNIDAIYSKYYQGKSAEKFEHRYQRLIRENILCPELQEFFKIDPYEMRSRAFEGKQLTPFQLGRIMYQFGLRRGYRETLQDGDDKGAIYSGNIKENRTGISETLEKISEFGSLGNYLHNEDPHTKRLRNRYTLRSMYTAEFDKIFESQRAYYPEILNEDFYRKIGHRDASDTEKNGILFYQRKLRSQKHLLGNCSFETSKPVAPKSCLDFELFRALTYATNIRVNDEPLSAEDQQRVVDYILSQSAPKAFKDLYKRLSNPNANYNYDKEEKLPSSPTHSGLKKVFKTTWKDMSDKQKEDLWHLKYWAKDPEWLSNYLEKTHHLNEKQKIQFKKLRLAAGYASMSRKALRNITSFLKKGYGYDEAALLAGIKNALGKKWGTFELAERATIEDTCIAMAKDGSDGPAIERIKDFLIDQYDLSARELKKLYHHSFSQSEVLGKYLPEPENVRNPVVQQAMYQLRKAYNTLVEEYGTPSHVKVEMARDLKGSKKERDKARKDIMSRRETNIHIKKLLDRYNQPHTSENIQKVQLYEEIVNRFGSAANPFKPSQTFSWEDLFGKGTVQIEHIVPLSKSLNNSLGNKTLCDADTNRAKGNRTPFEYYTAIGADWAQVKRDIFKILPYQKAKRFINESNDDAEDFISRQLNDTRYISRYAVGYLRKACRDVDIVQGTVSSLLRHHWGLDSILNPSYLLDVPSGEYFAAVNEEQELVAHEPWQADVKKTITRLAKYGKVLNGNVAHGKFYPRKDRDDHRHHAIDALVVALSRRTHLQQLSTAHAKGVNFRELKREGKHVIERPWKSIWTDTRRAVDAILVYHHQNNRVLAKTKKRLFDRNGKPVSINGKPIFSMGYAARGPLHKESVYGAHPGPDGTNQYHIRKPLDFIETHKHLEKVVDKGIREAISDRLRTIGVDVDNPKGWKLSDLDKEVKATAFFVSDDTGTYPQVFLKNRNGSHVPIKKVRIKEEIGNAEQLKEGVNQFVNPKNNHHVIICQDADGEFHEDVVSFWKAVERMKQKVPVYQPLPETKAIFSLEENDLFLLGLPDHLVENWIDLDMQLLHDHIYRVQKVSSMYYVFRKHTASSIKYDSQMKSIRSFKAFSVENPRKVKLSVTGKIKPW